MTILNDKQRSTLCRLLLGQFIQCKRVLAETNKNSMRMLEIHTSSQSVTSKEWIQSKTTKADRLNPLDRNLPR